MAGWVKEHSPILGFGLRLADAMWVLVSHLAVVFFVGEPWRDGLVAEALAERGAVGFGDWKTYGRKGIDAASVGRYQALPRPIVRHLAALCNPTLARLGYPEVAVEDESDADARRRYELGLLINRMRAEKGSE